MNEASPNVEALYDELLASDGWSCDDGDPGPDGASVRCGRNGETVAGHGADRDAALRDAWSRTEGGLRELLRALGWREIRASDDRGAITLTVSRGGDADAGGASRFEQRGATEREALAAAYDRAVRLAENQD